ncbi:MAG: hypothetical protein ACREEC_04370, partial [Thermoplasmata archaeon]
RELLTLLRREGPSATALLVVGPGFLKEELQERIAEEAPELRKKLKVYSTAESGRVGVDELLRSGKASEALRGSVAAEEAEVVERLVRTLAGRRRTAVGPREVSEAVEAGAVETLLVSESRLVDDALAATLDRARALRVKIFVVRDDGEAGHRLAALGRIAAMLRYDWTASAPATTGSTGPPRAGPRNGA